MPRQAEDVLRRGIVENPLISKYLPLEVSKTVSKIHFSGSDIPTLPVNWRIAESAAALHGLEAALVSVLLERKYGTTPPEVEINT